MKLAIKTNWVMLVAALLAMTYSLSQAAMAEPGLIKDPQPVLADAINKLIDRLSENADRIRDDSSIAYQISDELIAPHIDFPRITRLVIGKYWRDASEAQRRQLVDEIRALLTRSYVTAMTSYVDQIVAKKDQISYMPSRYTPGDNKASVRASIALDTGQSVEVQYQLYIGDDEWKIYDIRIEGISLAISYRTSFGDKIQRDGLDALIAQLAERNLKGEVELPDSVESLKTPASDNAAGR
ncbi:MAG: ABC transporter substrate-binding protein [Thiogranum sp.]|nr:ABC transporter substrate-binding protein [Thiogranum sp.]